MYKRLLRIISILLVLLLAFQSTGVLNIAAYELNSSDKASQESDNAVDIIGEDISKREESVKHFRMSDGTWMAVAYSDVVHYQASDGSWQEIDNTLQMDTTEISVPIVAMANEAESMSVEVDVETDVSQNNIITIDDSAYVNTSNNFGVSLPSELNEQNWVVTSHGGYDLYFRFENIDSSTATVDIPETLATTAENDSSDMLQVNASSNVTYTDVLPGMDVVYTLSGQQLKESLWFDALENTPDTLSFVLFAEGLELEEVDDGSIIFSAEGKPYFILPAPYLIDSDGESSGGVIVAIDEIAADTYRFTYELDQEWIQSEDRVWPIILDPVTCASATRDTIIDTYIRSGFPTYRYSDAFYFFTGYFSGASKNVRSFIQHTSPPTLNSGDVVVKAEFQATGRIYETSGAITTNMLVTAHAITSSWTATSATWSNPPSFESEVLDFQIIDSTSFRTYTWDITSAAQRWYSGDLAGKGQLGYNGVMLKAPYDEDTGTVHLAQFYAEDGSGVWPQLLIYYRNTTGIESYWDYTSADAGRAGTVSVNDYTGNLVVSRTDLAYSGNRMPASMSFTYNANDYNQNIGYGNGWRSNYTQTVKSITVGSVSYYCWIDGDGTRIYFYNDGGTWKDENGLEYTLTVLTSGYRIQDRDNNQLVFDGYGRLTQIIDGNVSSNKNQITYVSGVTTPKISTVTDGAGRKYTFAYGSDGNLSNIKYVGTGSAALETVTYTYASNQLTKVTYADNNTATYTYSNGYLASTIGCQNDSITISYSTGNTARVKKVEVKDGTTLVSNASFIYGDNYTKVTDNNGRWCIYQFNNLGNTVSLYNQQGQALYGTYSEETPNQLIKSSRLQDTVTNLLSTRSYTGNWNTSVTVTAGKTYTLSGTGVGTGIKALQLTVNGAVYTSDAVTTGRAEVTAVVPSGVTTVTISGTGDFKDLQFEQAEAASRYNMLYNTDMTSAGSWSG